MMKSVIILSLLTFGLSTGCSNEKENQNVRAEPEGANPGECSDGADNDFDGDYDCNDEDCAGAPDCFERDCNDGADNDRDGDYDCDDSDCADDEICQPVVDTADEDSGDVDIYEGDEPGECADGIDNDGDGAVDCDDEDCSGSPDCDTQTDIGTETNPGFSCKDILDNGGSTGDGSYWINPTGSAFEAYCDMTTDNGGWTMVSNTVKSDAHNWGTEGIWTNTATLGDISTAISNDYKNAFWSVESDDIMYKIGMSEEYGVFNSCLQGVSLPSIFSQSWITSSEVLYCTSDTVTASACEGALAFKSYNLGNEQGKAMLSCRTDNSNNADRGIGIVWHNQTCNGEDFGCSPWGQSNNFQIYPSITLWLR
jgi:hypothetical protein